MSRRTVVPLLLLALAAFPSPAAGQGFGGFGGGGSYSSSDRNDHAFSGIWHTGDVAGALPPDLALRYITVDGTAEIRVRPQEIRLVLAVLAEGETAEQCRSEIARRIEAVRGLWGELDIPAEKIAEDFISVLPRYTWQIEERQGTDFLVQHLDGYRMQTNLHVAVGTEAEAMEAVRQAFARGVSDIITFDYWSGELDEKKREARRSALDAAREKADLLLSEFTDRPPLINVQERTKAFLPHELYRTFENVLEEKIEWSGGSRNPRVKAYRPKMTFFDGLKSTADVRPGEPALRPAISVVSTVRLYYQSPATNTPPPAVP